MCSLSYYPVDGGPWERHGASRYHLSDKKPFRAPPPGPVAIHPSTQGQPLRRKTTSRVREALRRAPVPLDLSLGSAAGEFRSSAVGPSAARRRVSHIAGRRRSFGCCGSVLSTAQGSCTRDLCRDIEGKQPLLTTSSCRGGASYKQAQGAAP
mgnify:CR=1 FL=1